MLEPSRVIGVRENLADFFAVHVVWFRVVVLLMQIERAAGGWNDGGWSSS